VGDTIIKYKNTGEILAIVQGIDPALLSEQDFYQLDPS
jgi:hypothetical protein